jgi:hypothetical protein
MKKGFKNFTILWAFSLLIIINSCDDGLVEPPAVAGIDGRVWVQNEFGQPLYEERSGISIFLQTGFRSFNVSGDNAGRYRVGNAPVGTYMARYSKSGFSTIERRNLRLNTANPVFEVLNGFHQFPSVTLTELPTTGFVNMATNLQGSGDVAEPFELTVGATLVPPPPPTGQAKGYRVFVSTGTEVSSSVYVYQSHYTSTNALFEIALGNELFGEIPNTSGSIISVILYGDANFDESYLNEDDELIFPNLSTAPSQIMSVVLP